MTDIYSRPGKVLHSFSRLYPDAWKQVDEFRPKGRNLGIGPTDASCLWREPTSSSRRRRPFRLMDQSQAEEKPWIKWEHHGRGSVPERTLKPHWHRRRVSGVRGDP